MLKHVDKGMFSKQHSCFVTAAALQTPSFRQLMLDLIVRQVVNGIVSQAGPNDKCHLFTHIKLSHGKARNKSQHMITDHICWQCRNHICPFFDTSHSLSEGIHSYVFHLTPPHTTQKKGTLHGSFENGLASQNAANS